MDADRLDPPFPWIGKTVFPLLKPKAKKGYRWESGRETKVQA